MVELANMNEVIQSWRSKGTSLLPPSEEREVIERLSCTGRPFARDVVRLYCMTGGMDDGEMDDRLLCLWTLERLVMQNSKHARPHLRFADFLINSHCYGLKFKDDENSSVYVDHFDDEASLCVADSLDEFFHLYLNDPSRILLWSEP